MNTLFLFSKYLNEEGCFCLKMNAEGELITPPAQRNFAEILSLQNEGQTLIIETAANASLLELELPWLAERKARAAIPYALEDKVAQPVDELHFAFDKTRHNNNRYLITVISKHRVQYIMYLLAEHDIEFTAITLDWFALAPQELCVSESILLVNTDEFKGALSAELAASYLKKNPLQHPLLFKDSLINQDASLTKSEEYSYAWIARRILKSKIMNLCQGSMQHGNKSDHIKKGYQLAGILFCLWLVSLVVVDAINLYLVNKQTSKVDEQIAVIYREFFPDAKQIISPKFRVSQLLQNNTEGNQAHFWFLLNQFSKAMNNDKLTLEQLRYQNKTLSVTLISTDFASLEHLENQLKQLQLKVKQTQAPTREQQVVATLELM